jgi:hypothetical protein
MSPRSDAPNYVVGERVCGVIDDHPGSIVSVDTEAETFDVRWNDGMFPITYPVGYNLVRKAMPWET